MEMRLVFCIWFYFLIPGSYGALTMKPINKAVLQGASRVVMSCSSDAAAEAISWGYLPVGDSAAVDITYGGLLVSNSQKQYYAVEKSGDQQNNLIILNATMARAGMYICREGVSFQASAQLIVLYSDPVCSTTPNDLKDLLYNQAVQMTCSISYTANTSYVTVDMIWSKDGSDTVVVSSTPNTTTSSTLTTAVSTITQTPGYTKSFPIYRCNTTFKISGSPPSGSTNAPDYSKSTQLFNSPINVIYLKPADASSITGARYGDRVYLGANVTCNVEANPSASYSWLDIVYGNTTNSSSIQIWHDGEFRCTAWNNAASTSVSINVTTYITTTASTTTATSTTSATTTVTTFNTRGTQSISDTSGSDTGGGLSNGAKVGIGVGIGVGGFLILAGIILAVLNRRYEWIKRKQTDGKLDSRPEGSDTRKTNGDNSNVLQYEPLKILSTQNSSSVGPTYEQLTTSTNVDVAEHNLHNRPIYENTENTSNENESSSAAYQSLQHRQQLSPSHEYEAIKTNQ